MQLCILGVGLAAVAVVSPAARAADDDFDTHFKFYGGPAYVASMGDSNVTFGTVEDTIENESQVGWNLGFEGRFNDWVGIELDYVHANQDVSFGGSTIVPTSPVTTMSASPPRSASRTSRSAEAWERLRYANRSPGLRLNGGSTNP